jgi:hypothetical protein
LELSLKSEGFNLKILACDPLDDLPTARHLGRYTSYGNPIPPKSLQGFNLQYTDTDIELRFDSVDSSLCVESLKFSEP